MKIKEPVFIEKVKKLGYVATGKLEGHGIIREYGRSMEQAKDRFFEACNRLGRRSEIPKRHVRHRLQFT